jgi:ribonuclease Z
MQVLFLGTGSGKPSNHRNVTSIAVIFENSEYILIDCGEATQHQILKSSLKLSKLQAIYITHLHGDHIFGLPGLLCSLNETRTSPLNIVGPKGLAGSIHFALKSIKKYKISIFEHDETYVSNEYSHISGNYKYTVDMAQIEHDISCYAYKITKSRFIHKINMDLLLPDLNRYRKQLEIVGIVPAEKIINTLKQGGTIIMDDDFCFDGEKYIAPHVSKSLVIALDNYDSFDMTMVFENCDTLIHECTYSLFNTMEKNERNDIVKMAREHKHSTNVDALNVAKKLNASQLILTHFSNRYYFENEADIIAGSGSKNGISIACARDFMQFCICNI